MQTVTTTTVTKIKRQYGRAALLNLLFPDTDFSHIDWGSRGVTLSVHVPGGGDYSNEDLEVGDDTPLEVSFTMTGSEHEIVGGDDND